MIAGDREIAERVADLLAEGPRTGYALAVELASRFGLPLAGRQGSLYAALLHLEREGFLESRWETQPGGDRRRVYRLPVLRDADCPPEREILP